MHVSYPIRAAAATRPRPSPRPLSARRPPGLAGACLRAALLFAALLPALLLPALRLGAAPTAGAPVQEVYLTETGFRYHRGGCPHLQRSRLSLPLPEASALGYTPCGACSPPPPPVPAAPAPALYRVDLAGLSRCEDAELEAMPRALVVRPVDGDTIRVAMPLPPPGLRRLERVRLIGVDCPDPDDPETVGPGREALGREAGEFTRRRLLGQVVRLAGDRQLRDRYGRLLAYVYLPDGSCHNAELLRQGLARAYTRFPFQFLRQFRALEAAARRKG